MERTIIHLQRRVRCVKRATVLTKNDEQEEGEAWDWGKGRRGERRNREVSGGAAVGEGLQARMVGDGVERGMLL